MTYATDADLTDRVSAAEAVAEDIRALALLDAEAEIDDTAFGDRAVRAHVMLAAHILALAGEIPPGDGGLATSKSAGGISASYATGTIDDPLLATTRYGREYLRLRSGLVSYPEVG